MADNENRVLPIATALGILRPQSRWSIEADDWATVDWQDVPEDKPTKEEVEAMAQQLLDAAPLRRLRQLRDERLREVDWVTLRAVRTGEPIPQEWRDYMQALADITDQVGNATLSGREIFGINWPERPDGKPAGNQRAQRGLFGL